MARRAWDEGWEKHPWATPIKDVLFEERMAAKAAVIKQRDVLRAKSLENRELAQQESVDVLLAEANMLKLGRNSVTAALGAAGVLWPAVRKVVEMAKAKLDAGAADMSIREAMQVARAYAWIVSLGAGAADTLIQAERRRKGEPTDILAVQHSTEPVSLEEAVEQLEHARGLIEHARSSGLIPSEHKDAAAPGPGNGVGANGVPKPAN
jgi:hypothetical protein